MLIIEVLHGKVRYRERAPVFLSARQVTGNYKEKSESGREDRGCFKYAGQGILWWPREITAMRKDR